MELLDLLPKVCEVAKEAGAFIREQRQSFSDDAVEDKGFHDVVSYVDKQSEQLVVSRLTDLWPSAGFITEEKTVISKTDAEYEWIIDPLDGTTNFVHNIPAYCVSIALTYRRKVVLGVVYEITRDECYTAVKGEGAFLNGKPIKVSGTKNFERSLLATGIPFHDFSFQEQYINLLREAMTLGRGIRRIGSAALDLAYVASGKFDIFFEYNIHDYDMAAGVLLVEEAGGMVYDFNGGDNMLDKGSVVAGNPHLTPSFVALTQKYF
ncbi:inositol monophosphatase family protein [Olivibacter sitiensis]|uniref:inositol monophosphatase family protein n=1 Tax=Olivibacter sitiensis TaxID=376470 RepID=UPI0005699EAC|nr:inositol monophosphatase family protein [Olivibacter sitiensis]